MKRPYQVTLQNALYLTADEVARLSSKTKDEVLQMIVFKGIKFHEIPRNDIGTDILIKRDEIFKNDLINYPKSMSLSSKKYITAQEASGLINLKPRTIYNKVQKGEIPHIKKGRKLYFKPKELINWIEEGNLK